MFKIENYLRNNPKKSALTIVIGYLIISLVALITVGFGLRFNYDLENFFPSNDDDMEFYTSYSKKYTSDFDLNFIALTHPVSIYDTAFLRDVKTLSDSLKLNQYVKQVITPLQLARYKMALPQPIALPYLRFNNDSLLQKDRIIIKNTTHFIRDFISPNEKTLLILVQCKPQLTNEDCKIFLEDITKLIKKIPFKEYRLAGRIKAQNYIVDKMKWEFVMLALLTIIGLCAIIYYTYRTIYAVLLCAGVVSLGLLFTLFAMIVLGHQLNVVSIILPNILFVVGVSDSVHVFNSYISLINSGKSKLDALLTTIKDIGLATFLTAITASIGFFTLISVNVLPISDFGIFSALGILIIFVISFTLLPALLFLLPTFQLADDKNLLKDNWFITMYHTVNRYQRFIIVCFVVAAVPVFVGISKLEVNNFFTEELRENDPHKKDFMFFDATFGGVRPFELAIQCKDTSVTMFDYRIVKSIEKIEYYLKNTYKVSGITSSNTLVKLANQLNNNGADTAYCVSKNDSTHVVNNNIIAIMQQREELRAVITDDALNARITGRIEDIGALRAKKINAEFYQFINTTIDTNLISCRITGIGTILDKNNDYLTENLMNGLITELLAIALLMGLLFRSLPITFIALIPNIIPLAFIAALMGFLGIHLNLSSSILFNIAFGICVDDTIHLLGAFRINIKKGMNKNEALYDAYLHSGKAVATTTVILIIGFAVLLLSDFNGIFNTGLLVGVTLVVALFSDLFLLQILIQKFYKIKKKISN